MRIEYIQFNNYRPFVNTKIDFSSTPEKNFIIIVAENGKGKTSLMSGVTWCLYGKELHVDKKGISEFPIYNVDIASKLKPDEVIDVSVEMAFDVNGDKYTIKRSQSFKKVMGDNDLRKIHNETFEAMIKEKGKDWRPTNPGIFVERNLPYSINEYFFFNGERLDEYFSENSREKIKQEVQNISQIVLLDKLIKHLTDVYDEYSKNQKWSNPMVAETQAEVDMYKKSIESAKEGLKKTQSDLGGWEKDEKNLREEYDKCKVANIKVMHAKRIELEAKIKRNDENISQLEDERLDLLITNSPGVICSNALEKSRSIIEKIEEANELPPLYRRIFLERLLENKVCICGTNLGKNAACRKKLEKSLEECSEITNISDELIELNVRLSSILDGFGSFLENQKIVSRKIKGLEDERVLIDKEFSEVQGVLRKLGDKYDVNLEQKLQRARDQISSLNRDIGQKEKAIEMSEKSLKLVEKKLADEMKKESKHTELSKICSFCQESLNVANTIRDEIMMDIRKRIQKKTEEQFLTLIEDKEDFTGVEIDDQYNVSVTHKSGYRACTTLSAGQQQVLALSFMAALNVISGFSNPILIDTPLARISNTPQKNIADKLTEYLPDRQIVLLVLPDKEYTEHLRSKIHSRISKEYRIIKDSKGLSQVENYDKKR